MTIKTPEISLSTQDSELGTDFSLSCPIPISEYPKVLLAHGSGGKLMHNLLEKVMLPAFSNPLLETRHDGAVFAAGNAKMAFTTDSYVVHPLFFPGGDIGSLAVNGTVNDLAMCGARPLYLSAGFIIEEGLPMESLWRIVQSMQAAANAAGVQIVTGDTKVVDKGKGDGIFINTAGVGLIEHNLTIAPSSVRPGDVVLLNGDIGRHGMAIMAAREGLEFESTIESDCAPLNGIVQSLLDAGIEIHCLRDITRGGLASGLVEIGESSGLHIHIDEGAVAVTESVRGACEILGLDPLYVANEGRFIAFVPAHQAEQARTIMGADAAVIGAVQDDGSTYVTLRSAIGAIRIVDMLSGEQLPRIC
ncbi:MAG: hydrogenase expression/formation protein HypE [Anaerolineae bacterium]|nr:hydrogenase expression/formation protein HypE [Anaerolineae bacterium]